MNQKRIGEFIAKKRNNLGLTQKQLAEELYVTDKTISRWETGVYMPDLSMLILLSQKLNVSVYELLTGEDMYNEKEKNDNIESEVRYYYSISEEKNIIDYINSFDELKYKGKFYEKTIQYDHSCKDLSFYKKEIDARFRVRISKNNEIQKCMISYKRRLGKVKENEINNEEEVELSINFNEYDNLIYILENVLKLKLIESYERYRHVFYNDDVEIVVDIYPFILALEIENKSVDKDPKAVILYYLNKFNLRLENSYKLSWDDKYSELCKEQNITKYNIVTFDKEMPKYNKAFKKI